MKNLKNKTLIPSVNFHLWEPCNFRCKFCFATFQDVKKSILPKGHLPKDEALKLIDLIAESGFSKITFAGGEPTLCPWIGDLIVQAKIKGLTTMIVTNGTGIHEQFLSDVNGFLDWVVLSIDSIEPGFNLRSGRHQNTKIIPDAEYYEVKINLVNKWNIKLKINTVINNSNYKDYKLTPFIISQKPIRWKIFQTLKVEGQNDKQFDEISITEDKFKSFLDANNIQDLPFAIVENNKAMTGTYIMIDPAGRFFDNTKGYHTYSAPILKVGVQTALSGISYDFDEFVERGGLYDF